MTATLLTVLHVLLAVWLLLRAPLSARAAEPAPDAAPAPPTWPVKVIKDLEYAPKDPAQPRKHKLDLYLPDGAERFPVLFFIHGGGWHSGDKDFFFGAYGHVGKAFARHGIGTVVISYRLSPAVKHPAHIQDVARAFAWTVGNIAKYGGRTDQIFVSGQSAGGHLAALLTVDDRWLKAEGLAVTDIKASLPISGVYRINGEKLFDSAFPRGGEARDDASPITKVRAAAPPTLVLYAESELPGLSAMAKEFAATLKKAGTDVTLTEIPGKNHISIIFDVGKRDDPTTAAMLEFIAKQPGVSLPLPTQARAKPARAGE
jgi:acetyl esterase/lipase